MAIAPEPGNTKCPTCSSAMVPVGVTKEEGSDRAVSRLPRLWSSAQGTRRSVLVALRLVGPAVPAIDSACVDPKQALPAMVGNETGPLSNVARRVLNAPARPCLSRGY
jgi:hypothetical protein